jgi:two-component system, OmpR family, sensor kinase
LTLAGKRGGAWPRFGATLFVQVVTLVLLCLATAQAISVAIVLSVPPPAPVVYRVAEVAQVLKGVAITPRDGAPLEVTTADHPPPVFFNGPYTRNSKAELARLLNVAEDAIVISNEPLRFKPVRIQPSEIRSLPRDEHLLIAPFRVALHRADGRWSIVRPREPFPNVWQRNIIISFLVSAAALAPVAYLFARRLLDPIGAFAAAAERLGRDPGAPPLHLKGPFEVQQATAAFNVMQERLRRYVDDRTAMVGAVAHDLRTPLTRLRFRIEGAPDELRAKMAADIDQMDAMVSSALSFVRDATKPYDRLKLELSSLVESVADEMAETGLEVSAESAPPVVIDGDPVALRRLVTNLLDNAVKFGSRARARVYREDGAAVIEVDDDGPGIPEAERERVFEPFHRGEPSRSRETGGAGLGLAVVRSVARAHGGEASVTNRAEGGLRASARLPL